MRGAVLLTETVGQRKPGSLGQKRVGANMRPTYVDCRRRKREQYRLRRLILDRAKAFDLGDQGKQGMLMGEQHEQGENRAWLVDDNYRGRRAH